MQGEYQDLSAEGAPLSLGDIQDIYYRKTAKLFELCMFAGARIAGGSPGQVDALVGFGTHLGLSFQAIYDILDLTSSEGLLGKTTGKDLLQDKATVVKALGLEEARAWARDMTAKAVELLPAVRTDGMEALKELAFSMLQRVA